MSKYANRIVDRMVRVNKLLHSGLWYELNVDGMSICRSGDKSIIEATADHIRVAVAAEIDRAVRKGRANQRWETHNRRSKVRIGLKEACDE